MAKLKPSEFHVVATLMSHQLAAWLHAHPDRWWAADGEFQLMQTVNFPCPGDELAEVLKKKPNRPLEILQAADAPSVIPAVNAKSFDAYADTSNRRRAKNFLLRWRGHDEPWLLSEDVGASESNRG